MTNRYETPEVFDLGRAKEKIMGRKPMLPEVEAVLGFGFRVEPLPDDIDESDD